MTPSKPQKRPVVKTTGIKIGLTLAAVGASIGGWATMGLHSLNNTTVAQATTTQQTASTAAESTTTNGSAATGSSNTASNTTSAATQSSSSTGTTSSATQSSSSNQSTTSIQPVARTSSSQ